MVVGLKEIKYMKYYVNFIQYHEYEVEADSESEAEDKAYEEFASDMRRPIAQCWYDDVEIDCDKEDECEEEEEEE